MFNFLVYPLLHPIPWLVLIAWGIYTYRTRVPRWGKIGFGGLVWFFSCPVFIHHLVADFEFKYLPPQPACLAPRHYHILVLGAGKNNDTRLSANQRLSETALARLVEGVRWAHVFPTAQLIGSGPVGEGDRSQARLMTDTAERLGVAAHRLHVQEEVHNTQTEALAYVQRFGRDTPLILCTSALHLPRAVRFFQLAGVREVIPAPAQFTAPRKKLTWEDWLPSFSSLGLWQAYAKERIGYHFAPLWFKKKT